MKGNFFLTTRPIISDRVSLHSLNNRKLIIQTTDIHTQSHYIHICVQTHTNALVIPPAGFTFSLWIFKQLNCNRDLKYGLCCGQVCLRTAWKNQKQRSLLL